MNPLFRYRAGFIINRKRKIKPNTKQKRKCENVYKHVFFFTSKNDFKRIVGLERIRRARHEGKNSLKKRCS